MVCKPGNISCTVDILNRTSSTSWISQSVFQQYYSVIGSMYNIMFHKVHYYLLYSILNDISIYLIIILTLFVVVFVW